MRTLWRRTGHFVTIAAALALVAASPAFAKKRHGGVRGFVEKVKEAPKEAEKGLQNVGKAVEKGAHDGGKAIEKGAHDGGKAIEKGAHDTGEAFKAKPKKDDPSKY